LWTFKILSVNSFEIAVCYRNRVMATNQLFTGLPKAAELL
jgi:hypothetical protein